MATKKTQAEPDQREVHYVGEAGMYVTRAGETYATDPTLTITLDEETAASLVETGLYAEGPAPKAAGGEA